jgi:hypothetical protein
MASFSSYLGFEMFGLCLLVRVFKTSRKILQEIES